MKTIEQLRQSKLKIHNTRSLIFYLSGKISGFEMWQYEQNFKASHFKVFMSHYFEGGDMIINPCNLMPFLGIKTWLCYMITDIANLLKSDAVVFQDNWTESKGAKVEMWFALLTNKYIILQWLNIGKYQVSAIMVKALYWWEQMTSANVSIAFLLMATDALLNCAEMGILWMGSNDKM